MKRLFFLLLLVAFAPFAHAQFIQLSEGPVFPDTTSGYARILQMKNGSTMFLLINFTTGINAHVYESKYHIKTETNLTPAYGSLSSGKVESIFEINGDAVLMISDTKENEKILYRLIIDGKSGSLKEEKKIASVRTSAAKKKSAVQPDLFVRKDPNSENYAVALINSVLPDTGRRVEIISYGSNNKETNRGTTSTQIEKYKYLQFVDMAVIGTEKIACLFYGFNFKERDEKEGELMLVDLNKSTGAVGIAELNLSNDFVVQQGLTRYDPLIKRLIILLTVNVKSKANEPQSYLGFLDPATKLLPTMTVIGPGEKVLDKYSQVFGKKTSYNGYPQNLFINDDGTYTIIFEELKGEEDKSGSRTTISNVVVTTISREGEQKSAYLIPMNHVVSNTILPQFYQSQRENTAQQVLNNNQYKSVKYISDGHNSFVMFNDIDKNDKVAEDGKSTPLTDITYADGYYYKLSGNEIIPKREYIFGKPAPDKQHRLALFTISDYDKADDLFVVLKVEKEDSHPGVHLVWLQP